MLTILELLTGRVCEMFVYKHKKQWNTFKRSLLFLKKIQNLRVNN